MTNRRTVLAGTALVAAGWVVWQTGIIQKLRPAPKFDFADLADPVGFRTIAGGPTTASSDPFIGLGNTAPPALINARKTIGNDLCSALFGALSDDPTTVQVAYFYDYRCPICKTLSPRLKHLPNVQITYHDVANIAPVSETAARGAIAARKQGAFDAFHIRLMRAALHPDGAYIRAIADGMGLDADRLIADMTDPATDAEIWRARALSERFAMAGTPGLVIGRTVVTGDVPDRVLDELVKLERARGPVTCQ